MGVVALSAEAYARMLKQLLPPGRWRLDDNGVLSRAFLAASEELSRIGQRGADLIVESDPRTTAELLPDFEETLAIEAEGTIDDRRARVVAKKLRRQRARPADYRLALGPLLGQATDDVVVIEVSRADAIAMNNDRAIYRFFIYRDPNAPGTYDLVAAQDAVDSIAYSHTVGHVIESIGARCDDPFSLCDRDILGV